MRAAALWAVVVAASLPGHAQADPPPPPPAPASEAAGAEEHKRPGDDQRLTEEQQRLAKEKLVEQAIEQMQALRMWRITEELKLDEATAAKLFPLLSNYDDVLKPVGHERHVLQRQLRELVERPGAEPARALQLVDQLMANRAKTMRIEDERIAAARRVLSPLQQAKLVLILPMIEEGFRRRIRAAMGGRKPGDHDHPRGHRGSRDRREAGERAEPPARPTP